MKNYKVRVLRFFTDKVEKKDRNVGDTFLCDKERYEFLKKNNAVELVGIQVTMDDAGEEVTIKQDKEFNAEIKKEDLEKKDKVVEEIITKKKKTSKK